MKILFLGDTGPNATIGVEMARFKSNRSLMDFEFVIYDTSAIYKEYSNSFPDCEFNEYQANKNFDPFWNHWENEFSEFLAQGRTVLALMSASPGASVHRSGPPYNTVVTYSPIGVIGIQNVNFTEAHGTEIKFRGHQRYKEIFATLSADMEYRAYLRDLAGTPFLYASDTDRIIGTHLSVEGGNVLLAPYLSKLASNKWQLYATVINENIRQKKRSLPEWTLKVLLPGESEILESLKGLNTERAALELKFLAEHEKLSMLAQYKTLLAGTGDPLELETIKVFREIGFKAEAGAEGRDDIILKYGEKHGVAEVKGVTGSAAEKHAAQLEKWVTTLLADKGLHAKGFLVINAFCDAPLAERRLPAFPDQMLKFSKAREHCLITTMQLLAICFEIKKDASKRDALVKSMFDTVGIYSGFEDYFK